MPDNTKEFKAKVLIVEDEVLIAADLESRLKGLGYTVCGKTTSPEKALLLVEQDQPDLVVMDIVIEGEIDGIDAAEVIRDKWGIPVVFLTAFEDSDKLERAKLTYPFGHIIQPFQDRELKITVEMALYVANVELERRRAEAQLAEQISIMRGILDTATSPIFSLDRDYRYTSFNRTHASVMKALYGADIQIGHSQLDYLTVEPDREYAKKNMDRALKGEHVVESAYSGEELRTRGYFEIIHNPIENESGEIIGVSVFTQDITERKRTEDALRESELKYRGIFDESVAPIYVFDKEKKFIDSNQAGLDLLGYSRAELLGMSTSDVDADSVVVLPAHAQLLSGERLINYEHRLKRKDGKVITVLNNSRPLTDDQGNVIGMQNTLTDITDRKQAEDNLRRIEALLNATQRLSKVGGWEWDIKSQKMFWSYEVYRIHDLDPKALEPGSEDHIVKSVDCYLPEDRPVILDAFKKCAEEGTPYDLEFLFTTAKGRRIWIRTTAQPVFEEGTVSRVIGNLMDITDWKRTEEALRENEGFIRAVMDNLPIGVAVNSVDPNVDFTYMNDNFPKFYRTSREKLVDPDAFWDAVYEEPAFREEMKKRVLDDCASGDPERMYWEDVPITRKGEETSYISASNTPIPGKHLMVSTVWNVTERKRAEEALRESEERFRDIVENSDAGYFFIDKDGLIQNVNEAWKKIHKYSSAEEIIGNHFTIIQKEDDIEKAKEFIDGIMKGKKEYLSGEFSRKCKDNSIGYHNFTAKPVIKSGEVIGIEGFIIDSTERKNADEALRKSEERFRDMVEGSIQGVLIHRDKKALFVNQACSDIFGYSKNEILEMETVWKLIHPDEHTRLAEYREARLRGEDAPSYYEYIGIRKDGSEIRLDNMVRVVNWSGENAIQMIVVDITERKRAEEEREILHAQLQQSRKMEAVGTLAGGIAHDFNNLLQAISGYTQIMLLDKQENDPDYPNLEAIHKAVKRAAQLVRQLLLFSRKVETERKSIELNQELEHTRRILERTIPRMVAIELHLGSRLWSINADPVQIEQVLLNLGSNAADAMPDGGILTFETENVTLYKEYARTRLYAEPGNYVLLTVSDTGQGMDKETVEHIFEPFYTTKEIGKGTGLGLASVYGIVKSHGGYITCDSEVGKGTIFKLYFPANKQTDTDVEMDIFAKPPKGGTETILLVDDEDTIRDFASQVLHRFGYTVQTASSGEEALEIYVSKPDEIDLVILDIGMPGMGGHRCLRELLRINPSARIVVASGYSIDGQLKKTLKSGAAEYVGKPYQVIDLLNKVRAVFDEKE